MHFLEHQEPNFKFHDFLLKNVSQESIFLLQKIQPWEVLYKGTKIYFIDKGYYCEAILCHIVCVGILSIKYMFELVF